MRNIYIEVGVVDLTKVTVFHGSHKDKEWHFELFEPNPPNVERTKALMDKSSVPNIKMHQVAVGAKEGPRTFYYAGGYGLGSSLYLGKRFITESCNIQVDCIDFNEWIINNISKDDYVHMSMDIEGSEYEVLPHMINGGSISYIDSMEIEFHAKKFKGENGERFRKINEELKTFFSTLDAEKTFWKF